jgi:hypothetical protein
MSRASNTPGWNSFMLTRSIGPYHHVTADFTGFRHLISREFAT